MVKKIGISISSSYLLPRCLLGRTLLRHLLELPLVADEARDEDGDDGDERDDDKERGESRRRQTHAVHDLARVLHPTLRECHLLIWIESFILAYQTCAQLRHFDERPRARLKHLEHGDVEVLVFGGEREVGLGHDLVSRLHPQLRTALAPVVRNAALPPLQLFQLKQWIPCL